MKLNCVPLKLNFFELGLLRDYLFLQQEHLNGLLVRLEFHLIGHSRKMPTPANYTDRSLVQIEFLQFPDKFDSFRTKDLPHDGPP
jgi:hypothetical protein